jgi:hypothetical protein
LLLVGLELGQQERMSDADLLGIEGLDDGCGELGEFEAGGDIGRTLARLCGNLLDAVLRFFQIEKSAKALRLFKRMDVTPLQVFNQLRFEGLGIRDVDDADGNGGNFGDLRSAKTSRPSDYLETLFGEWPNEKRREDALTADAVSQFLEGRIFEDAAPIGLRLVEKREGNPAADFKPRDVLAAIESENFAHVDEEDLTELLAKMDDYNGDALTRLD